MGAGATALALASAMVGSCGPSTSDPASSEGEAERSESVAGAPPARPHIVVFLADDLGWGDVGYHGSRIRTPTIDGLRESGVELDRFYVQPSCSPTRAALLTGRYPIRYGLQTGVIRPWSNYGLDTEERLLPEALGEAGYATHIVGKWHLGCSREELLPTRRGFDHHYGLYTGKADSFTRMRQGALDWHRDGEPVREEGYTTHLLRDEAVRIIREHDAERPLFLYLAFNAPHFPLQAPDEEIEPYRSVFKDENRQLYAAMVTCMDEAMGDVLGALDERGMRGETLVLFLSDNGASPKYGGSNGALAGEKNEIGEGGVRVPAIASWPGVLAPARRDGWMHVVDLYPTLLGLAGASLEQERPLDGVDLWPALARGDRVERDVLLVNMAPNRGAVIAGDWKLVLDYQARNAGDIAADPLLGTELFDLSSDPGESTNLAASELKARQPMLKELARFRREMAPQPDDRLNAMPEGFRVPDAWGPH